MAKELKKYKFKVYLFTPGGRIHTSMTLTTKLITGARLKVLIKKEMKDKKFACYEILES